LKPFVEELIQNLFRALPARKEVTRQLEITPVSIDVERAISIGLIINELVTNAVKHALVRHESPHFRLQIGEQNNMLVMEIEDNGPGFVLDSSQDGFGHKLIQLLLRKMQGSIRQKTKTCLHLVFKLN
jgi:two-component system response regulator